MRRALQDLARAAATDDPHTGLAVWASDAPSVELGAISADQRDLVSAVAPVSRVTRPWEPEVRTFIHERLREHLVAEHLAAEPVDQAYRHLESHIWYDPKWQYILPAAIYLHPQQDQLLAMILDRGGVTVGAAAACPEGDGVLEVRSLLRRLLDLGNGTAPTDPAHRASVERIALSTSTRNVVAWSNTTWGDYTGDAAALDRQLDAALEHQPIPEARSGTSVVWHHPPARSEPPETLIEIKWRLSAEHFAREDANPAADDAFFEASFVASGEAAREAFEQIVTFVGGDAPDKEVLWERSLELIEHHRGQVDSWLDDPSPVPELLSLLRSTGCPPAKVRSALVAFGDILMGSRFFASENGSGDDWDESHRLIARAVDACSSDDDRELLCSILTERLCAGSYYDWLAHAMGLAIVRLGPTAEQIARSVSHLVAQLVEHDSNWEYCYVPTAEVACALFAAHPDPATLIPSIEAPALDLRVELFRRLAEIVRRRSTLDEWTHLLPAFARCIGGPDWDGEVTTVHPAQVDHSRSGRPA